MWPRLSTAGLIGAIRTPPARCSSTPARQARSVFRTGPETAGRFPSCTAFHYNPALNFSVSSMRKVSRRAVCLLEIPVSRRLEPAVQGSPLSLAARGWRGTGGPSTPEKSIFATWRPRGITFT